MRYFVDIIIVRISLSKVEDWFICSFTIFFTVSF